MSLLSHRGILIVLNKLSKYKSSRALNSRPLALLTTCVTNLPTQHYVSMFQVLFFCLVHCASKINKIVYLVN
jgi:hypothetical protein